MFVARGQGESYRLSGVRRRREAARRPVRRSWRHLPTCQYRTILTAEVPRVRCSEHGVHTIGVPWSDPGSRFTALFEALVIDWLGAASMSAVARLLDLSWDQVDGAMQRAVKRGLERRGPAPASRRLGWAGLIQGRYPALALRRGRDPTNSRASDKQAAVRPTTAPPPDRSPPPAPPPTPRWHPL